MRDTTKKKMGNAVMAILTFAEELAGNGIDDNIIEIQEAIDTARGIANMYELRETKNIDWLIGAINYDAKDQGLLDRVQ